ERIAVFLRAAGTAADGLTRTIQTRGVQQIEVVPKLVRVDTELVVAVAPGLAIADVGEARPAAVAAIRKDVEAVLVIGQDEACRGRSGVARVADGGIVAGRRHSA